jgi:quercetin dioxygenase-like cupin family protein
MNDLPPPLMPLAWNRDDTPDPASVAERLRAEGVQPYAWSNGPGDAYPAHEHPYTKLIMCAAGSIIFRIGPDATPVELVAGDGFILPPWTLHAADVGPSGCTCLEGHR